MFFQIPGYGGFPRGGPQFMMPRNMPGAMSMMAGVYPPQQMPQRPPFTTRRSGNNSSQAPRQSNRSNMNPTPAQVIYLQFYMYIELANEPVEMPSKISFDFLTSALLFSFP